MSRVKVVVPPEPALTLAEGKSAARVTHDDDDADVSAMIQTGQRKLDGPEGVLGVALGLQTLEAALDAFPTDAIRLPMGPAVSVVSVEYTDADGATQTVPPGDYVLDTYSAEPWIVPFVAWPSTMATINAVRVQWVAGREEYPEEARSAIKLLVSHLYDNRNAVGPKLEELPLGVWFLVSSLRVVSI